MAFQLGMEDGCMGKSPRSWERLRKTLNRHLPPTADTYVTKLHARKMRQVYGAAHAIARHHARVAEAGYAVNLLP